MIEKFSDEELKQIMKELGVSANSTKYCVCKEEAEEIRRLWFGKPCNDQTFVYKLVDITLCNYETKKKKHSAKGKPYYGKEYETDVIARTIKQEDKEEYKQMFNEILQVIKKHNRKWERDTD